MGELSLGAYPSGGQMGNPGLCASDAFSDWRENMPEFYHAANFFVRHPERAWAIAALFFVFFFISFFLIGQRHLA